MFCFCTICEFIRILIPAAIIAFLLLFCCFIIYLIYLKWMISRKKIRKNVDEFSIGFFHPFCNAGGGGERVLWCAIRMIQIRYPSIKIVVYTGDLDSSPDELIARCKSKFNFDLQPNIEFIYLRRRSWVEHHNYKYFTLLGQSMGSIWLGLEALQNHIPDIYFDTMGYAFTFPLFKYIANSTVCCYVHYPTISSDMLHRVHDRISTHNNRNIISSSPFFTQAKMLYYRFFAKIYAFVGRFADCVIVNSSWTEEHINEIWECPSKTHRVYPPCDVEIFKEIPLPEGQEKDMNNKIRIVSIAQFRPEKDHPLQLRAMHILRQTISSDELWDKIELVFIGSCRNAEDESRVKDLKDLAKQLALDKNVKFRVNVSFEELKEELANSLIGLHAMWNEHFGIGIVECMAAGLIVVAHNSGGPRMDIIETSEASRNGFLASHEEEYAETLAQIINMPEKIRQEIRIAARVSVDRFSESEFNKGILRVIEPLIKIKYTK